MATEIVLAICCKRMEAGRDIQADNFRLQVDGSVDLHADNGDLVFGDIEFCPFCGKGFSLDEREAHGGTDTEQAEYGDAHK